MLGVQVKLASLAAVVGFIAALQFVAAVVAAPMAQPFTARPAAEILRGELRPDDQAALYAGYFRAMPFYLQRIPYFLFGYREVDCNDTLCDSLATEPIPMTVVSFTRQATACAELP
jgi:hypothetical protein